MFAYVCLPQLRDCGGADVCRILSIMYVPYYLYTWIILWMMDSLPHGYSTHSNDCTMPQRIVKRFDIARIQLFFKVTIFSH